MRLLLVCIQDIGKQVQVVRLVGALVRIFQDKVVLREEIMQVLIGREVLIRMVLHLKEEECHMILLRNQLLEVLGLFHLGLVVLVQVAEPHLIINNSKRGIDREHKLSWKS
jgi:hypothetical protein